MSPRIELPDESLVLLVGAAGSGKSTFAARHFTATQVVSSDRMRALIGDDPGDQSVTAAAFELVHALVEKRLEHRRFTVVDATNVEKRAREGLLRVAKSRHVRVDAVVLDVPIDVCIERDAARERSVGEAVVREHHLYMGGIPRALDSEGFRAIHHLDGVDAIEGAEVARVPLANDLRHETGPFDVIGDVHGCAAELRDLLAALGYDEDGAHPEGRRVVFLGDLVDRGPSVVEVLKIAMRMMERHGALCVMGNHEAKLARALEGRNVKIAHGLKASLDQLAREDTSFREAVRELIAAMPDHYRLDGGALVVAHAGLPERLHGRVSKKTWAHALFGDTSGATDAHGLPVRRDWGQHYRGDAVVIYGHTPTADVRWVNETICIDTGCVFGGALTAVRWPEREIVQVPARETYYVPAAMLSVER